ncbi:MAG: hypothetical protein IIA88_09075 [Bacteroidetes bacterium]|nr:hypothetical protein [Bacteroidota bacterium]
MEAQKFISKVLPDGHLSIPKEISKKIGKSYEVILVPLDDIDSYSEELIKKKGLENLTESDIEKIIHESRGIK